MDDKFKRERAKDPIHQRNEGEGNKTATRQYNESQRQFVRSEETDQQAHAAEEALDSVERRELDHAELIGRRHAADEDPAVKKR